MADGGEEYGSRGFFGMVERERDRDRAAEGVTDDDGFRDAEFVHQRRDCRRLTVGQIVCPGAARRPAVSGPVDEEQVGAPGERIAEGDNLVGEIAACAMQKDDRRQIGTVVRLFQDVVHPRAVRGREFSGWRVVALNVADADAGRRG